MNNEHVIAGVSEMSSTCLLQSNKYDTDPQMLLTEHPSCTKLAATFMKICISSIVVHHLNWGVSHIFMEGSILFLNTVMWNSYFLVNYPTHQNLTCICVCRNTHALT